MSNQDQTGRTRSADKINAAMEAIKKTASAMNLAMPNTTTSEQLNQDRDLVRPNEVIWLRVDKEETKRLNLEEFRDNGWFLFIVSGMVTDVSIPTVNLQFYRKNVSDQEVGAVLVNNQAWEVYSAVQDKTANQARLLRIKDKTHPHNKLTKVTITDPYQTTSVLAAEDQLNFVSREAVQVVSQDKETKFHLDENGAVVLDEIWSLCPGSPLARLLRILFPIGPQQQVQMLFGRDQ